MLNNHYFRIVAMASREACETRAWCSGCVAKPSNDAIVIPLRIHWDAIELPLRSHYQSIVIPMRLQSDSDSKGQLASPVARDPMVHPLRLHCDLLVIRKK